MHLIAKPDSQFIHGFEIGRYDRIMLDGAEMKLTIDGDNGKVFERVGDNGLPIVMSNEDLHRARERDGLVVEQRYYDPRNSVRDFESRAVRDLSEDQQKDIAFRLEWASRLGRWRNEVGPVAHADRRKVMETIASQYREEMETAKGREHFRKLRRTYEQEQFHLVVPAYETVSEWLLKLKRSGGDPLSLRDRRGTGKRKSAFTEQEQDLQGKFIRRYLSLTRPNISFLYRVMKAVQRRLNKDRPADDQLNLGSRATFYNRIKALPDFVKYLGREGEAKAKAKYMIVIGKDRGHPMDLVEADECRLDLTVLLDKLEIWDQLTAEEQDAYRQASERLWFSAVIDHASTYFLSFRIHSQAPSTATALATFELTAKDKTEIARAAGCRSDWAGCGSFRQARLDSAAWYRSTAVTSTLSDAGCAKSHPPAKISALRGTMERAFGVLGHLALSNLSGRTFSNIVQRGDQDPKAGASVNVYMLEQIMLRVIVDLFHDMRNSGKLGGMTPRQAWLEGCRDKQPPYPPTGARRRHIYGKNLKRVITSEGICVIGFFYQSDKAQEMRRNRTGVEVHIRVDLWDLGEITIFDGEHSYSVPARIGKLKGMSYWQATALLDELDLIDTDYTNRTQDQVDAAVEFIDVQGDVARATRSLASPILTDEHVARVERHIRRPLRITDDSEYTREVSAQDWSRTPFLDEAWGLSDPAQGDDLDVPQSQSAEAIAEKYGSVEPKAKRRRRSKKAEPAPQSLPLSEQDRPRGPKYYEEF